MDIEMIDNIEKYVWTIYENDKEYIRVLDIDEDDFGCLNVALEVLSKTVVIKLENGKIPTSIIPFELYLEKIKGYEKTEPFLYFTLVNSLINRSRRNES